MRMSFLALTMVALVASSMTAASAFNWASVSRTVGATIVTDNGNAYLAIESAGDAAYTCLMSWTNGKFAVTFNAGSSCSTGTGVNPDSKYYFADVIKITNKGSKNLAAVWLNMTDSVIETKAATTANTNMMTTTGWSANTAPGALTIGSTIYVGFLVDTDTTNLDTATGSVSKTLTIEAKAAGG